MSLNPVELLSAQPWQRVTCTTYALSLSFFEAVILDALVRGGTSHAQILSDVEGVRASLGELGAQRVGKDYEVEPVAVSNGVFHPKVSVLYSKDECHVLVGSGNLTFGGWGGNCELLEHLHPSFAADAIADVASFFELMATSARLKHNAGAHCTEVAADLRQACEGRPSNADIRVLHNLGSSIGDQLVPLVEDLGGATQLVAAAPFWDNGAAIDRLCRSLGLDRVHVHSHEHGCVRGKGGNYWPRHASVTVEPVRLEILTSEEKRRLHAKAFEILCRRGRIVISGSANGSGAALGAGQNVEACVVRIQRDRTIGWSFVPATEPTTAPPPDEEDETRTGQIGVLSAVLEADELTGTVFSPQMSGTITAFLLGPSGPQSLGEATVAPNGNFRLAAPHVEEMAWRGGRVVIRVQDETGSQAQGFVSIAAYGAISRRTGPIGHRLFAIIAGTETPDDVAAIMAWFQEDPLRLTGAAPSAAWHGITRTSGDSVDELVPVSTLGSREFRAAAEDGDGGIAHRHWERVIDRFLCALRKSRGPLSRPGAGRPHEDDDEEDGGEASSVTATKSTTVAATPYRYDSFESVLAALTNDGASATNVFTALDLSRYVCERLRPDAAQARIWLQRLVNALLHVDVPPEQQEAVAACVLALLGTAPTPEMYRSARGWLIRFRVDLDRNPPAADGARGFLDVLPQPLTFHSLWSHLANVRTYAEQRREYARALNKGSPSADYPDLQRASPKEWPILERAITSPAARGLLSFVEAGSTSCPHCAMSLPPSEIGKLSSIGIARALHCCERILIVEGD